jgi:tetratricopeptide (TPR) repeat protein
MSPYDIIPLVIIVVSLAGIIFIIARKFPVLAAIDIGSIKSEQEAAKKEKIIISRLERKISGLGVIFLKIFSPLGLFFKNLFKGVYGWARSWEKKNVKSKENIPPVPGEVEQKIKSLFFSAEELFVSGKLEEAEQKYIEIIAMDHKNIEAYKKLGAVYLEQKNYSNAKETFLHILKLVPDDMETLIDIGSLLKQQGENEKALRFFLRVAELEPTNPKNLDFLIEISIMVGNKDLALKTLAKLGEVNPENQKLSEFEERIKSI